MKNINPFRRMFSAFFTPSRSKAYDFKAKNTDGITIYYRLINDGTEAEVTCKFNNNQPQISYFDEIINIPETVAYGGKTLSVTSIGNRAFSGCSDLISVNTGNGVTSIGNYAFSGCSNLTSVNIGNGVTSIGNYAFSGCSSLTSVNTGNGVTSIGSWAFSRCSRLTSINIPEGVTSIGDRVFYNCSGLTSITIPDGVTSIGNHAFSDCSGLTSVTIPNDVTSIGDMAFYGCNSLTSVTIGKGVASIGDWAFSYCKDLTSVYSLIENPFGIPSGVFNGVARGATLYVPQGAKSAYEAIKEWTRYFSNVVELNTTDISE